MDKENRYDVKCSEFEIVPFQEATQAKDDKRRQTYPQTEGKLSLLKQLRQDSFIRFKITLSIWVTLAFSLLGWTKGQLGPAFVDLLVISGTNIEKGSGFMTSYFTGCAIGPVLGGLLASKVNIYLMFAMSLIVNGLALAVIPWCWFYELMVAAHVLYGISGGVFAAVVTSEALSIWGPTDRGRSYIQIINACFAVAAFVSPMATAPFLLNTSNDTTMIKNLSVTIPTLHSVHHNVTVIPTILFTASLHSKPQGDKTLPYRYFNTSHFTTGVSHITGSLHNDSNTENQQKSRLFIAYSISAGIATFASIPFIFIFCTSKANGIKKVDKVELKFVEGHSNFVNRLQLLNVGVCSLIFHAIDFTFTGYMAVFCVRYLNWTKTSGSLLTSTFFFAKFIVRCLGTFLVRYLQSHTFLLISAISFTLGFVVLIASVHIHFAVCIWISTFVIGLALGVMWPSFLSWTNENLIKVNSTISAFMIVTGYLGPLLSPLLCGYLMERFSLIWFLYICSGMSTICVLNTSFMNVYTRTLRKKENGEHG